MSSVDNKDQHELRQNLDMFLGLTQTPQKNAEAHLLSLVLPPDGQQERSDLQKTRLNCFSLRPANFVSRLSSVDKKRFCVFCVRPHDGVIPSVERDPAQVSCSKFAKSTARFLATLKMTLHFKPYTLNPKQEQACK